jgi:3-oxoacyl-[acyl-carrier-protein] synthase III
MSTRTKIGILGIGVYLPQEVRRNDWWPASTVEAWRKSIPELLPKMGTEARSEGQRCVMEAIKGLAGDPFYGARERRIADDRRFWSEMETLAAKEALANANVKAEQVEAVLTYSSIPDYLTSPNACAIHKALGVSRSALSVAVDPVCNAFHQQLSLAQALIESGQTRYAVLVQSHALRWLIRPDSPASAWNGDAATAVVVGPVSPRFGVEAIAHRTDGSFHDAIVTCPPERKWYEGGPMLWHARDGARARAIIMDVCDQGKEVVHDAVGRAGHGLDEVDFYASHQATVWFADVTKRFIGLDRARTLSTFPWAGSLGASNVPFVLATAAKEGMLKSGDLVATYGGGSGLTWSSAVVRWGVE